ncbi:MAG TPA: hypothetical protein VK306_01425 [Acidimicrobiales bacterium]|nr:hypothetical protein [Acidimicrobiales bacterium]
MARDGERLQCHDRLARDAQRLVARGEQSDGRARPQQHDRHQRRLGEDVLAVVEDHEQVGACERRRRAVERIAVGAVTHPERGRDDLVDLARSRAGEIDHDGAVGQGRGDPRRHVERGRGLADAARADERDEARGPEALTHLGPFGVAADDAGQGSGQRGSRCPRPATVEARVLQQDRPLDPAQLAAGLEPRFLGERAHGTLVRP